MTDPVSRCGDHGVVPGETCPVCGRAAERVLSGERRRRLSTFLSGTLRHFPEDVGVDLDDAGWTPFAGLVAAAARKYDWADRAAVAAVVATDPKGRFERTGGDDGDRVRAAYGHSVDVDLGAAETPVPDTLYHGTAPGNVDAIRQAGLRPMGRQHVHLSGTPAAAREVGRRHAAEPVVLAVDAAGMAAEGYRLVERGRTVYTTDRVPPAYLSIDEG